MILLPLCPLLRAQTDEAALIEALKTNSPFGTPPPPAASEKTMGDKLSTADIQLQGIAYIEGAWMFSLVDAKKKTAMWIKLGETKMGCTVESYDPKDGIVNVQAEGKTYPLSLKNRDPLAATPTPGAQMQPGADGNPPPPPWGRRGTRPTIEQRKAFLEMMKKRIEEDEKQEKQNPQPAAK